MQNAHVIGAGGIGVALAWSLARAGWKVALVDVNPRKIEAGRRDGIYVDGRGERNLSIVNFTDWSAPEDAPVLLCTKTYDNAAVLARLTAHRWLIPVQNGFEPELDRCEHACEGIASFVSECERDRPVTRITREGDLYLGGRRGLEPAERTALEALATALQAGGRKAVRVVDRIGPYKLTKLMYNAAISPLATSAGVDNAQLLSDPLARGLFFTLLRENYGILRRADVELARIGPFHPRTVDRILSLPGVARLLARFFQPGLRGTYCSMSPDIGTGRTEIASYNGHLKWLARGRNCPINTAVLELISTMQQKSLPPGRARLVELRNALATESAL